MSETYYMTGLYLRDVCFFEHQRVEQTRRPLSLEAIQETNERDFATLLSQNLEVGGYR
jgi:hypothetical protein